MALNGCLTNLKVQASMEFFGWVPPGPPEAFTTHSLLVRPLTASNPEIPTGLAFSM